MVKIALIHRRDLDPYFIAFYAPLERLGLQIVDEFGLTRRALAKAAGDVEVLHFHWLHTLFPRSGIGVVPGAARFLLLFQRARRLGYRVLYTAHNMLPHDTPMPRLDGMVARAVLRWADGVVAHTDWAAGRLRDMARRDLPIFRVPSMNYRGVFPEPPPREEARDRLGWPRDQFVYLAFGAARPYKRLPEIAAAFSRTPDADAALVIAGACQVPALTARLESAARADHRIRLALRGLSPPDLALMLAAADATVFAATTLLSSGSVPHALTAGHPVVAPDLPLFREMAPAAGGVFFPPGEMTAALRAARALDPGAARAANLARSREMDWPPLAPAFYQWLRDDVARR
ncbi:MAG: glycosyltransferase [Planctomycetes bacterium]|nr:glycosyltransferase [Planctomycetota bacterium]